MRKTRYACSVLMVVAAIVPCGVGFAQGRRGGGAGAGATPAEKPEEGIPVTDALVISRCGTCHQKDEKGNLSRISWERTTPEGWEEAIKRMVRLNGLTLEPAEARSILKYLSTYHGLAPEEAKPLMYIPEHRIQDEVIPNENIRTTCNNCHALGKALSWRRSKDDWKLLANMHVAFFPQADAAFRRFGPAPGAAAAAGGGRGGAAAAATAAEPGAAAGAGAQPVDETVDFLGKTYGLHSPEWANWRARMRPARLTGRWVISAWLPGKGRYTGEMVIEPGAGENEFKTSTTLQSVKDGSKLTRTGTSLVYSGYAWRGRSHGSATAKPAPDDPNQEAREVMWVSPDQTFADGRWFWGFYQEFGFDVHMQRATGGPVLLTTDLPSIKTGSQGARLRIFGEALPANIAAADLDLGSGVTVKRIVSHTPKEIVAELDVAADAVSGKRDVALPGAVLQSAFAVYDRVDYIKVIPETSMARLGGDVHPKGYQQLEAVGYQRGADGKPHTADDVELGPIEVNWSVEEFYAVFGDDDKEFVGTLNSTGFFTPALDGPNPQRKFKRNNYGDVWAVATTRNEKDKDGKPLVGKSYLIVAVPMYIQWDQPEVAK
jgi:quinohemoprotein amine dehydrogenase